MTSLASSEGHSPTHDAAHGPAIVDWPSDRFMGKASALKVGMWIFLLSDAFSFGGLLLTYGILRGGSQVWWHANEPALGIGFTAVLTFLLICSSVTMVRAVAAAREGKRSQVMAFLALTSWEGFCF